MKLSTRARYGLRALIDLGLYSREEAVSLQRIANRQNISFSYLEQLIAKLKKAGLVESTRGAQGGYRLGKPAEEISVGDVLRVLEGGLDAVACTGDSQEGSCVGADACVTKAVWKRINDSITAAVDSLMLSDLIEDSERCRDRLKSSGPKEEQVNCSDRYIIE
jgi:Rrf2 family protein